MGAASAVAAGEGMEPAVTAAVGARSVAALFCWRAWRASHVQRGPLLRRSTTLRTAQCGPVASHLLCAVTAERVSHGRSATSHSRSLHSGPHSGVAGITGIMCDALEGNGLLGRRRGRRHTLQPAKTKTTSVPLTVNVYSPGHSMYGRLACI